MTARRPKDIGTAAETAVVRYLRDNGFPHAERRAPHGNVDLGDITGTPNVVWEVKGGEAAKSASDGQIVKWLAETKTEQANAGADVGVLVVQRRQKNVADWWAVEAWHDGPKSWPVWVRLGDYVYQLRRDGFGEPVERAL